VIDMAISDDQHWSPPVKELNLFFHALSDADYAAADALTQGEVGKDIFKILEKSGVVPLAWGENGYREISNSSWRSNASRHEGPENPRWAHHWTPSRWCQPDPNELCRRATALATGAVDGQENRCRSTAGLHNSAQSTSRWGLRQRP
jgi:TRAP-type C4-dicarboxylate transport system substrate-binding protein